MSKVKILTIIIPTYNMEKYLRKCLDSLIISENLNSMEVLVINDGSTDKSSEIAHAYENQYPQTFRVIDKENGHYGSCINIGLKEATGKYVKILDADDWCKTDALKEYLLFLSTTDVDMIITDYNIVNPKGKVKRKITFDLPSAGLLKVEDYCCNDEFIKLQMHAVTYKRSILLENSYIQTEGVPFTDQEWIFLPVTFMDTSCYFHVCLYQYLVGREGQSMDPKIKISKKWVSFELLLKRNSMFRSLKDSEVVSKNKKTYLEKKLKSSVTRLYRNGIIYKMIDRETLRDYDERLKTEDRTLYDYVESASDKRLFGLRYVHYWRKTGRVNLLTSIIGFLLRKI